MLGYRKNVVFKPEQHAALHPKRSARVYIDNFPIGFVGELHPGIKQKIDVSVPIFLFEMDLSFLTNEVKARFREISKFPFVQRDIAILLPRDIAWEQIKQKIVAEVGELLQDVNIFDVYSGEGISADEKSVAIHLVFQHLSRTLIDEEVEAMMSKTIHMLEQNFNAKLRG